MKSDSRIVDARRRARATARATGNSYQNTLDEVARSAGRRDWEDFVANPGRIPDEVTCRPKPEPEASVEIADVASSEAAWYRRRPKQWAMALAASVLLLASLAWSASYDRDRGATNAGLSWERTVAISSRLLSMYEDNDKAMYVLAQELPGERRDVRLIMLDNRPANNGIVTRIALRTGLLDRGVRTFTESGGMFRVFERHPVARLHHRVDCRKGTMTYVGTEVADSMTSTPVAVMPARTIRVREVGAGDLRTICSRDTLDRTRRIRSGV